MPVGFIGMEFVDTKLEIEMLNGIRLPVVLDFDMISVNQLGDTMKVKALSTLATPTGSGDTTKTINIGTDNTGHSATATTVTNRAYEEAQQLLYSQIRLLKSDYLSQFVQEFEDLIDEGVET